MTARVVIAATVAAALLAGCDTSPIEIDLERMTTQPKYRPFDPSDFFADGRVMQSPPEGTVPMDAEQGSEVTGRDGDEYLMELPLPRTRSLLVRGRDRYDVFCAPCHGVLGDGDAPVAERMALRRPPPLVGSAAKALSAGRTFAVVTEGYGLMRSYARELPVRDRWAVVGYLQALALSRSAKLASLPPRVRARVEKELP